MFRSKHCWPWKRTQVEQRRESWRGGRLSDKPWSASYFSESVKFSQALWSLQLQTDSTAFLSTLNWPLKPGSLSYACSEFWLFLCWESPAGSPPTSLVVTSEMLPINKIRQKCCPPAFLPPNSAITRSLATFWLDDWPHCQWRSHRVTSVVAAWRYLRTWTSQTPAHQNCVDNHLQELVLIALS